MRANRTFFVLLAGVVALAGAGLAWQRREGSELRAGIARQNAQLAERARLEAENRRLAAAQPTDAEMEALVARLLKAEQVRAQLIALRQREEAAAKVSAAPAPAEGLPKPSLAGKSVSHELWQNVGQASPDAAFETALWASAKGDLDALSGLLALDADARSLAAATFDRLPAAMQSELATPERLIAFLTAMDVPLGRASIYGQFARPAGMKVGAHLVDAAGKTKTAMFSMEAEGDRWRLKVPVAVVQKYAGWLGVPAAGR
jgi:hypothetical protein